MRQIAFCCWFEKHVKIEVTRTAVPMCFPYMQVSLPPQFLHHGKNEFDLAILTLREPLPIDESAAFNVGCFHDAIEHQESPSAVTSNAQVKRRRDTAQEHPDVVELHQLSVVRHADRIWGECRWLSGRQKQGDVVVLLWRRGVQAPAGKTLFCTSPANEASLL